MADIEPSKPAIADADYTIRVSSPYLLGTYLAINAIPDAYLLLDGPNCFPLKSPAIQGNHDWGSTLTNVSGYQRTLTTHAHPSNVVFSRRDVILESIESITAYEGCGGLFVTARPMASLTGEDYEAIVRDGRPRGEKQVFYVAPKSLSSNWLGGYEQALLSLAEKLVLGTPAPVKDEVAIVGYMFDRHEGDHAANLRELSRYFEALGLRLRTVWLSGQGLGDLASIRHASAIVSLPYGRKAARCLGERLGVPVVETCLPFGLQATQNFLREVGAALDRSARAEELIDRELSDVVPKLEWVVPFVFQNAAVGFIGDPNHVRGLQDILGTLGARLSFAFVTGHPRQLPPQLAGELCGDPAILSFDPTQRELLSVIGQQIRDRGLDLVVACNTGVKLGHVPTFEFGYPSYFTHALAPRPFLGFAGCLAFVDTMANTIRHAQLY